MCACESLARVVLVGVCVISRLYLNFVRRDFDEIKKKVDAEQEKR